MPIWYEKGKIIDYMINYLYAKQLEVSNVWPRGLKRELVVSVFALELRKPLLFFAPISFSA